MTVSVSVMQDNPTPVAACPLILASLPDMPVVDGECPRRTRSHLDLLLLAIEALDLTGSEAILSISRDLELQSVIRNRVVLWRIRSTNPMRRFSQRRPMSLAEAKALTVIICYLARRLTVLLRQLVMASQQLAEKNLTPEHHLRLADYLQRFRSHFRARMNSRRTGLVYDSDERLNELAMVQLSRLLFCTSTSGMQRLWVSLFDGEVA